MVRTTAIIAALVITTAAPANDLRQHTLWECAIGQSVFIDDTIKLSANYQTGQGTVEIKGWPPYAAEYRKEIIKESWTINEPIKTTFIVLIGGSGRASDAEGFKLPLDCTRPVGLPSQTRP